MGFFDLLRQKDINQGLLDFKAVEGAVLLDVRTAEEYRQGHIPGSINISLQMQNFFQKTVVIYSPLKVRHI